MPKIVFINAVVGEKSTGLIVSDLVALAKKAGFNTLTCAPSKKADYKIGNFIDWKAHALLARLLGKQGFYSKIVTHKLIKQLRREKPDIIHLHNLHGNFINIPSLFKYIKKENVKPVITLHDCWFFTGKCFHFIECGCDKWKTICHDCPQKHQGINSIFLDRSKSVFLEKKLLYDNIDNLSVVSCSKWMDKLAKKSPLFRNKTFYQIYNGVDVSVFHPINIYDNSFYKNNIPSNAFIIMCFASKLLHSKNMDIAKTFIERLKTDDFLIVVGCKKEHKEFLNTYPNIIPLPYITDRRIMAEIYNSSNVFVNLTLSDTLPTVNMESICCGTPVITYDSCGSPELIQEGRTGFVVNKFDLENLMNKIECIRNRLLTKGECASIGINTFDKNRQYQKYVDLYREILN